MMRTTREDFDDLDGTRHEQAIVLVSPDGQASTRVTGAHGTLAEARREVEEARINEEIDWSAVETCGEGDR